MNQKVENLKGKLIVSCQALPDEPLHSSFIMGRMALAAKQGGASGIRANTKEDIKEIRSQVDLPVIGIVKRDYDDSDIYITPTMKEIEENDFNLNIPRYVDTSEEEIPVDLEQVTKEINDISNEIEETSNELKKYFEQLGLAFPNIM